MEARKGEMSTPIKLVIGAVATLVITLILLTVQRGLLQSAKEPITAFINTAVGGL